MQETTLSKKARRSALALFLMLLPVLAHAGPERLLVFAAASLGDAMDDVAAAYEADHPTDVAVSYAGSSTLARQIQRGAPAQVYVSANQAWMDRLARDGLIDKASRVDLLRNALVLIAPAGRDVSLKIAPHFALAAALGDGYLAMADTDAVPAGIYGREALQSLGVWASLRGHIAPAADVRAALALVARGEAPLGVVYTSDAVAAKRVQVVDTFAADSHDPIVYPAAIVADAQNRAAARFMSFLQSDAAARIFRRWGFEPLR